MNLHSKLKNIRLNKNLSIKECSELIGVNVKTYSAWENNKSLPQVDNLIKICKGLQISPDELLD